MRRVKSLKHAKNEVRFERVFMKITKIFAKITREAPGFFGGPSSLDHEGLTLMKIFCKSGSGSQPHGKVPGRKKPERAQVHKKSKMFFKKRVLQLQKWQKMRVLRVLRVLCVLRVLRALRALRALWFQCFAVVFASRRCFGLSLQLIVLLRFEANFEFQKCAVTSSSFRRYKV